MNNNSHHLQTASEDGIYNEEDTHKRTELNSYEYYAYVHSYRRKKNPPMMTGFM